MRLERYRAGMSESQQQITDQRKCEAIEAQFNDLQTQIAAIAAAQAAADAAQVSANDAAAKALAAAREGARINSYPNPGSIVTASDAGSNATITIANHTRVYPVQGSIDVPDVSITGASLTGLPYSTQHWVYYDDTSLALTTPTFHATTSSATAQVGAAAGRHFVGYVTTPAAGSPPVTGEGGGTPGGGGGGGGHGSQIP
jgi:multidrug efflux pump subunit AcrA (membrane-fusion protein)